MRTDREVGLLEAIRDIDGPCGWCGYMELMECTGFPRRLLRGLLVKLVTDGEVEVLIPGSATVVESTQAYRLKEGAGS